METLTSRILKTEDIAWREAQWLQNKELKDFGDEDLSSLKQSLVNNDFVMPFNVWFDEENGIIWILDGHHRQLALEELEMEGVKIPEKLPATFIMCENRQQAAKLVLIYSSIYAKITASGLSIFLEDFDIDIDSISAEIDLPDFSLHRFQQKFNPVEVEDPEIKEVGEVIVEHGDIFRLNGHYVYCGDCFNEEFWKEYLAGRKADVVFTDPPYNLPANFFTNKGIARHEDFAMASGELSDVEFKDFLKNLMQLMCQFTRAGAIHYICMDFRHIWHMTQAGFEAYGCYDPKQMCVWNKDCGANGSFYRAKHELIFIYKNGKERHTSNIDLPDRIRYNVWDYPGGNSIANPDWEEIRNHPTPKPVQMVADALLDVTNLGELLIDFFLGSGTSLIAAEKTNRLSICSEINPAYLQHSILRWIKLCETEGREVHIEHLNGSKKLSDFKSLA